MVEQLNNLGKKRTPFFFCINYDKSEWMIHPLDALPSHIHVTFNDNSPCSTSSSSCNIIPDALPFHIYKEGFDTIMDHLQRGNTYLLNYTCATPIEIPFSLQEIYQRSCAPFKLLVDDHFVISSPERFVKISGTTIETFPMKGTINALAPDALNTLLNNEKERREHLMIVDLLRNDLAMVAQRVRVKSYRFAHKIHAGSTSLLQTSSHITGELEETWHERIGTIIDTLLPAGSITGAPKHSTCHIINDVEKTPRGFYTGIFGIYDGKNLDSAVSIRFIKQTSQGFVYHSGGGITLLSDPHSEYQEMLEKIYVPLV